MILDARRENTSTEVDFNSHDALHAEISAAKPALGRLATEVLNPKTASVLPLIHPAIRCRSGGHVFLQLFALGTISVVMNTTADLIVIALAGPLGERIRSSAVFRRRQRTATGAIMIGLGTYLATSESK